MSNTYQTIPFYVLVVTLTAQGVAFRGSEAPPPPPADPITIELPHTPESSTSVGPYSVAQLERLIAPAYVSTSAGAITAFTSMGPFRVMG